MCTSALVLATRSGSQTGSRSSQLQPLLDQPSSERRSSCGRTRWLDAEQLTASIGISTVDVDNNISTSLRAHATDSEFGWPS